MKKTITIVTALLMIMTTSSQAQTALKEYKAGHVFYVSLPDYMSKTTGINSSSTIQFKSTVKDVYGFIIEDSKEELKALEINYPSVNDFYEDFIKDFVKDEKKRKVIPSETKKIGETNFKECDVSYYDKDSKIELYYFVGLVETPTTFYKIICYCSLENKEKFKSDFQKILYSIKD